MEIFLLVGLILVNGLFAMSEVALLTSRKSRLTSLARGGDALAAAALRLSAEPTRFLSTIQIGITSIGILSGIVGEAALAAPLAIWFQSFGLESKPSGIAATGVVVLSITYVSIVVGELVPKRLGQHNAEGIARLAAWPMRMLAIVSAPFVHLLSASTDALLKPVLTLLGRHGTNEDSQALSVDEIRTIVLESSNVLPKKHATILLNLFDLEAITVDDVMVPRSQFEGVDLDAELEDITAQLSTSIHRRVLVYRGRPDEVLGTLRVRHALNLMRQGELSKDGLMELVRTPYYVPSGTPLFSQLQSFQEHQDRLSLVVDEYGELMGLVTLEDILEEIVGEFTTQSPLQQGRFFRQPDGSYVVEGGTLLRSLNRKLGFDFPLDGPKTLNGLILEHLQDIPEAGTSVKIGGHPLEIVQTQDRIIKSVRVFPAARVTPESAPGAPGKN